jgi:hypothetical protein
MSVRVAPTDLMTRAELANHLQVNPKMIAWWERQHLIPTRRLSFKVVRYCLADVVAGVSPRNGKNRTLRADGGMAKNLVAGTPSNPANSRPFRPSSRHGGKL